MAIAVTGVAIGNKPTNNTLYAGDSVNLSAVFTPADATDKSVIWVSSNTIAAPVSSLGQVTANSAGTSTITLTSTSSNKTDNFTLTVKSYGQPLTDVSQFQSCNDLDLLARMIYGEASDNITEQTGVAYVVYNRTKTGFRGQSTYKGTILYPGEFSSMDSNGQTLTPVLTSSKWTHALTTAKNFLSYANPIGSRLYFWSNDYYTQFHTTQTNPIIIGTTTFFDWN